MGLVEVTSGFSSWLLRPSLVLLESYQVHLGGELLQCADNALRAHAVEDLPLLCGSSNQHPIIGSLQTAGEVIGGNGYSLRSA
jgi:hypothetical protein